MFAEERDANGDRPGPYNLVIKSGDDKVNPNLIVEKIGNKEVRPIDLSITKVVCTVLYRWNIASFGYFDTCPLVS